MGRQLFFFANNLSGWSGEEQLVVFAVVDRLLNRRAACPWNGFGIEMKIDAGGIGQARQISSQAVAEVHERCRQLLLRQPLALGEPGLECEMPPRARATEPAGDEEDISCLRSGTEHGAITTAFAEQGHVEKKLLRAKRDAMKGCAPAGA